MKKINYSSQSLRHIISSAMVIVILLIIAACFLVTVSVMRAISLALFIISAITGLYLVVFITVDTFLDKLKHEHDKKQKHHTI